MQVRHLERGSEQTEKATKSNIGKRARSQKVLPLTQILQCTFFYNSIFIPPWFLVLQQAIKRAHPRKRLPMNLK